MRPLAWAVIITTLAARTTGHLNDETPAAARRLALFRKAAKRPRDKEYKTGVGPFANAPPKEPTQYGLAPIFRNPDPKAQWPRKRNWNNSRPASWTVANTERLCTGTRQSKDVIVYLGQKTHSSYDATHANTLNASMASLRKYMRRVSETDVIVWHEGDLTHEDANALDGATNVRFCLLRKETGWGRPPWLKKMPPSQFSAGYRFMIRFYAVTIWPTLDRLGYEWVMRMDDDSFFLSPVPYNIFEDMRRRGALYAYRTLSRECPVIFGDFVEDFVEYVSQTQRRRLASMRRLLGPRRKQPGVSYKPWYCPGPGRLGFYNNWFVTKIRWWLDDHRVAAGARIVASMAYHWLFCAQVAALIGAFDRSNLIFTRRSNDLIFQTAAIKLFLPKAQRRRYADFSYQHHTITNGAVLYGGIESGWRDRRARHTLRAYAQKHVGAHRDRDPQTGLRTNWTTPDLRVRSCHVQEHVDGPFRPTYYVAPPHDATQAHRQRPPNFIAPFCGPGRRTALE